MPLIWLFLALILAAILIIVSAAMIITWLFLAAVFLTAGLVMLLFVAILEG